MKSINGSIVSPYNGFRSLKIFVAVYFSLLNNNKCIIIRRCLWVGFSLYRFLLCLCVAN